MKLWSGRFWLTIISGLVFAYAVREKILPPTATAAIITMVFSNYFNRSDRKGGKENGKKEVEQN